MSHLHTFANAAEFLTLMRPILLADEARTGLMLGITERLVQHPDRIESPPFLAAVEDEQGVAAAAIMTPPHGIILYSQRQECSAALTQIADELYTKGWPVPTANGPIHLSAQFAQIWSARAGVHATQKMAQRIHVLRKVIPPRPAPGSLRTAVESDIDLLAPWIFDFTREALDGVENETLEEIRHNLELRIGDGMLYLWIDQEPVSLVGTGRPTAHGINIGPVYTPVPFRNRGYASAAVAEVSQRMLDSGRQFCTLFTDLANPTSNSIYQKIGYQPVEDFVLFTFAKNSSATSTPSAPAQNVRSGPTPS